MASCASTPHEVALQLSVVIPVRGHRESLASLLASLRQHAPSGVIREIVIVQDGPEEDLGETCDRYGAKRIVLSTQRGPAAARNTGVAATTSPVVLLMDADVQCPSGLFEAIDRIFAESPETDAISFLNPPYDSRATAVANFTSTLEYHWLSALLRGGSRARFPGVSVRTAAIRREAFDAVGGFDTRFNTNAIEDYDFGKRFAAARLSVVAAGPLVPHAYPRDFRRLVRNYAVRTSTYVAYVLRNRVSPDPVQTTGGEAALRLLGLGIWICAAAAPLPGAAPVALAAAGGGSVAYAWFLRHYLRKAAGWSGSSLFPLAALAIHLATAPVIAGAGAWGVLRAWRGFLKGSAQGSAIAEVRN